MGFMDIRHLYNPSSSFPSRLNVFYSITNIFQDSGPWSDRMNALEDLSKKTGKNHLVKPIAQFGAVLLAGVVALIAFALFQYTFQVILTLAVVESPPATYLPTNSKRRRKAVAVLGIDTPGAYATSSLCGAKKHLRSIAGRFAPWRGWNAHMAYLICVMTTKHFLAEVMGNITDGWSRPLSGLLSLLLLGQFAMACTHIIISRPQEKTWISARWGTAGQSTPAMVPFALAHTVATELCYYGVDSSSPRARIILLLSGAFISIFVTFPCMVALIRVQASHLFDAKEAIVSFDRSFGVTNVTGAIDFQQALKSVGCAGWKRIYWVAIKATSILVVVSVLIGVALVLGLAWVTSYGVLVEEVSEPFALIALIPVLEFFGTLRVLS